MLPNYMPSSEVGGSEVVFLMMSLYIRPTQRNIEGGDVALAAALKILKPKQIGKVFIPTL